MKSEESLRRSPGILLCFFLAKTNKLTDSNLIDNNDIDFICLELNKEFYMSYKEYSLDFLPILRFIKKFKERVKEFFQDEYGGNMVEYALLIGFALFIFFIIVGVITSLLNWTIGQSNGFFDLLG